MFHTNTHTHTHTSPQLAQLVQIASTEMFQSLYFSNHEREDERCICVGVVYAILSRGVRVQIPRWVQIYRQIKKLPGFEFLYVLFYAREKVVVMVVTQCVCDIGME